MRGREQQARVAVLMTMREIALRSVTTLLGVVVAAGLGGGCSHHSTPTTTAAVVPTPSGPVASGPTKAADTAPVPVSPHVAVSDDLARQCSIAVAHVDEAPKFDYDQFELLPDDRTVLQRVATCVTTGPLKGHSLRLVGRADPRGTDEYNLGLGTRRASAVGTYLERLGVKQPQIAETTRGALDASGRDESTWRVDRRVDLELNN